FSFIFGSFQRHGCPSEESHIRKSFRTQRINGVATALTHERNSGRPMTIYGYARVSTEGQTLAGQEAALREAGATKVYSEKISGARAEGRKALARAMVSLGPGDVLLVTRLDRLARSTRDLLNVLDTIAKAGAGFRSLADTWADTTTPHGRLMLTVLGGLAEFERELIRARTGEGRTRAKARGVHMGRPPALNKDQRREARERLEAGEALTDIARTFGVSHTTIGRLREGGA
ncbi:recombinase family protein, partial [Methylosinus sp. RM1]|uniref:recombinase family protein n=1 Tax=Methylosinus sp. RM1 TaxID=2583817 RepID=UPI00351AA4B8